MSEDELWIRVANEIDGNREFCSETTKRVMAIFGEFLKSPTPHYYRIILWNPATKEQQVALTRAHSAFQAEEKGREWAKKWEPIGYIFHGCYYAPDKIKNPEIGETVCLT
jgi:hypothetical protein